MRIDVEKISDRLGLVLGATIFLFGFLKLFEPFHSWFAVQIANSGLPAPAFALGIVGEMGTGISLLYSFFARRRSPASHHLIAAGASVSLVVIMCVATYVHLQTDVPAAVLPLRIKPPVIPLSFLVLATGDFVLHTRSWWGRDRAGNRSGASRPVQP